MALKIGDKVSTSASVDVNGTHLASFVRNNVYEIIQIGGQNYQDSRVVIGKDGKVMYTELVPEITQEPDYDKAIEAVKK